MVDTRDVAAVAAAVLTEPGHAGAAYDVTGPEALSYGDVADKLTTTLGRPVSYPVTWPVPEDRAGWWRPGSGPPAGHQWRRWGHGWR